MATTSTRIEFLVNGARDTAGAVVASGKVRAYEPGTSTPATIYSDAACTTGITQPLTLNAAGQGTVYTLNAVRIVVKDSTETTTYFDDIAPLVRAQSVYVTISGINGGEETTLHSVLGDIGTSFGDGFNYKESSTATSRSVADVLRGHAIQAEDYGVTADGSTDDTTAMQNAINRVEALVGTGGASARLLLPAGTIKITSALTIDTAGVSIEGQGRGISIISQASTSANGLNVTLGGAADAKLYLKGFTITAATTSSGTAFNVSVGNKVVVEDCASALFRSSFISSAATGTEFRHCFVDSTDGNASVVGMNLGPSCRAIRPEITSATDSGTGIILSGADARCYDPYITNFATAISATGARALIRDVNIAGPTTGVSLAAANGVLSGGLISGCTTGVSVGAVARCSVFDCVGSSNTTDLTVNASATYFEERGNTFSTYTNAGGSWAIGLGRMSRTITTDAGGSPSYTPVAGNNVHNAFQSTNAGAVTVTVNNVAETNQQNNDWLFVTVMAGPGGNASVSWGSQYKDPAGTGNLLGTVTTDNAVFFAFQWVAGSSQYWLAFRSPEMAK